MRIHKNFERKNLKEDQTKTQLIRDATYNIVSYISYAYEHDRVVCVLCTRERGRERERERGRGSEGDGKANSVVSAQMAIGRQEGTPRALRRRR